MRAPTDLIVCVPPDRLVFGRVLRERQRNEDLFLPFAPASDIGAWIQRDPTVTHVAPVRMCPDSDPRYHLRVARAYEVGTFVTLGTFFTERPDIALAVVRQNGRALQFVNEQTEEICRAAVEQQGFALEFVHEQTEEICRAAVRQNGMALRLVIEQTEEICRIAVENNGFALRFVRHQTREICLAALEKRGMALEYVREQTPELCLAAVKNYGYALQFVREQTEEICVAAVRQQHNQDVWNTVERPTITVATAVLKAAVRCELKDKPAWYRELCAKTCDVALRIRVMVGLRTFWWRNLI